VRTLCEAPLRNAYCGISHFPCAPVCDAYGVDLSPLRELAAGDPELRQCLARRGFASGAPPSPRPEPDAGAPQSAPRTPAIPDPPASAPGDCRALRTHAEGASTARPSLLVGVALLALGLRRRRVRCAQRQSER
jgi:hypothetical protein